MPTQPAEMFGHQEWGEQSLQTNPVGLIAYTAQFRGTKGEVKNTKTEDEYSKRKRHSGFVGRRTSLTARYAVFV